jgi:hypothetical protein
VLERQVLEISMKRTHLGLLAILLGTTVAPSVQADPVVAPMAPVVGQVVVPKPMAMAAEKRKAAYTTALRSFGGNVVIPAASQWNLSPVAPCKAERGSTRWTKGCGS